MHAASSAPPAPSAVSHSMTSERLCSWMESMRSTPSRSSERTDLLARPAVGAFTGLRRQEELARVPAQPGGDAQLGVAVARRDVDVVHAVLEQQLQRAVRVALRAARRALRRRRSRGTTRARWSRKVRVRSSARHYAACAAFASRGAYRRVMETETDGAAPQASSPWPARTGVSRTELDPTRSCAAARRSTPSASPWSTASCGGLRGAARAREPARLRAARARAGAARARRRAVPERARAARAPSRRAGGGRRARRDQHAPEPPTRSRTSWSTPGRGCCSSTAELGRCSSTAAGRLEVVRLGRRRTSGSSPRATRPACRRCCATRRSRSRSTTPRARPGSAEGRRLHLPRRVPERARRGDRGRARPSPGLPVDAADVPLQRLVLPVGGDRGGRHARLPARRWIRR